MRKLRSQAVAVGATVQSTAPDSKVVDMAAASRHLRGTPDKEFGEKVDRLAALRDSLEDLRKKFKKAMEPLESERDTLEAEILAHAKATESMQIRGEMAIAEVQPSVSRKIDPEVFLAFLKKAGQPKLLFKYVTVGMGAAEKDFGSSVLEQQGVIQHTRVEFGKLKLKRKLQ